MSVTTYITMAIVFIMMPVVMVNIFMVAKKMNVTNSINDMYYDFKPLLYRLYYRHKSENNIYVHSFNTAYIQYEGESFKRNIILDASSSFTHDIRFDIQYDKMIVTSTGIHGIDDSTCTVEFGRYFDDMTLEEFMEASFDTVSEFFNKLIHREISLENYYLCEAHDNIVSDKVYLDINSQMLMTKDEKELFVMEMVLNEK